MSNSRPPSEVLQLIFNHLNKADIQTCLEINKTWNNVARSYIQPFTNKLYVEGRNLKKLLNDLIHTPSFGLCIMAINFYLVDDDDSIIVAAILKFCINLQVLELNRHEPIKHLLEMKIELFNIKKIFIPTFDAYENQRFSKDYLLLNLMYKNSIEYLYLRSTKHNKLFSNFSELLSFIAEFPLLQNLHICWYDDRHKPEQQKVKKLIMDKVFYTKFYVDMHQIILTNQNLKRLILEDVYLKKCNDNTINEKIRSNLKDLRIKANKIDIEVLDYICLNFENLDYIIMVIDEFIQTKQLVDFEQTKNTLLNRICSLPIKYKVVDYTIGEKEYNYSNTE